MASVKRILRLTLVILTTSGLLGADYLRCCAGPMPNEAAIKQAGRSCCHKPAVTPAKCHSGKCCCCGRSPERQPSRSNLCSCRTSHKLPAVPVETLSWNSHRMVCESSSLDVVSFSGDEWPLEVATLASRNPVDTRSRLCIWVI